MKTSKILLALAIPALLASCSKQELPYDLDGVKHTISILVTKNQNHDRLMNFGTTDGDYVVNYDIPNNMGDYQSYFQEAQLLCVYTIAEQIVGGDTIPSSVKTTILKSGITVFPDSFKIDMPAVCSAIGITTPQPGDKMQITANIIHKDGTVVPGWTEYMGFNFRNPTFYETSEYCASFQAMPPMDESYLAGGNKVKMTESFTNPDYAAVYPVSVTKLTVIPDSIVGAGYTTADYIGVNLATGEWYAWGVDVSIDIYINKRDFSVIIPEQFFANTGDDFSDMLLGTTGTGHLQAYGVGGEYDTQRNILTCSWGVEWYLETGPDAPFYYDFGGDDYKIEFANVME